MATRSHLNRRSFLKRATTGALVANAAAATLLVTAEDAQAYNPGDSETHARYRADAPDVQAFYRTNGYETLKK